MKTVSVIAATGLLLVAVSALQADEVKIKGTHNCCAKCCKAIVEALSGVEGVTDVKAEPKNPDVSFAAADKKTARRALGALARAGIHGKVEGSDVKFPENSGVKEGEATRLELVGIHNCCAGCCKAAKDAIAKVEGVEADTLKPNSRRFVVEGKFKGLAVVKALNEAGFHVRSADARRGKKKQKKEEN